MRATGSSSASTRWRPRHPDSGSGSSKVGSASAALHRDDELRVLADHAQLNRGRREFGTDGAGGVRERLDEGEASRRLNCRAETLGDLLGVLVGKRGCVRDAYSDRL